MPPCLASPEIVTQEDTESHRFLSFVCSTSTVEARGVTVRARRSTSERLARLFIGGTEGNERLTATAGVLLLVLFAVEGATLLSIRSFLTLHIFIGMVLIPPVLLKLAATGYRFARYYTGHVPYHTKGPPR